MKRALTVAVAMLLLCTALSFAASADGENACGESLTWTLTDGTLTISGTGTMTNYSADCPAPWDINRGNITSVIINDGVTTIGEYAFYNCTALEKVSIPTSIKTILDEEGNVTVRGIGNYAFCGCIGLKTIQYPGTANDWSALKITTTNSDIYYAKISLLNNKFIPPKYGTCGENLTWAITTDESTKKETLTITGSGNMTDYYAESPWYNNVDYVVIESGVTSIGSFAFCDIEDIETVAIPASVASIGECAFSGCTNLESITYLGTKEQWGKITIDNTDLGNTALLCATVTCTDGTIEPETSGTCGDNLTWSLSNGVLRISGTGVMSDYVIEAYDNQDDNKMAPWYPLQGNIETVIVSDGVTRIGSFAFYGCVNLENAAILGGVETIGYAAFAGCSRLTSIVLPKSIKKVEGAAFADCSLERIYYTGTATEYSKIILETIETTGEKLKSVSRFYGVYGCGSVGDITWSLSADGILNITGSGDFSDTGVIDSVAETVKEVTINVGVTAIDGNLFSGCTALEKILYKGTEESWEEITGHDNVPTDNLYFTYYIGDADGDNKVTDKDCEEVLSYLRGQSTRLTESKQPVADVNGSNGIDVGDLQALYSRVKDEKFKATETVEIKAELKLKPKRQDESLPVLPCLCCRKNA